MLAILAKSNAYLGIPEPDMETLYILAGVIGIAAIFVIVFRMLGKWSESRKVKAASWRIYTNLAKVKGLTNLERKTLDVIVRKANPKRPSQVLASITLFDRCVDNAIDKEIISDVEQSLMESAREKLLRTKVTWDGHTERRQFERALMAFDVEASMVPKNDIDEELKTSYEETDAKFLEAMAGLSTQTPSVGARVLDLGAGGLALLTQDKTKISTGDYVKLAPGADQVPFQIDGMIGRVISSEKMQGQGQLTRHLTFLPIEQGQRRLIIQAVYATTGGGKKGDSNEKTAEAPKGEAPASNEAAPPKEN
jgi:hypothetical protein